MKKILITISFLLLLLGTVNGFNQSINEYIINKALIEKGHLVCDSQAFAGLQAPDTPTFKEEFTDITEDDLYCFENQDGTAPCKAKTIADQFFEKAKQQETACEQSYVVGIATRYYLATKTPTQWMRSTLECQEKFSALLEFKKELDKDWYLETQCRTEIGTVMDINYTKTQFTATINSLEQKWLEVKQLITTTKEEKELIKTLKSKLGVPQITDEQLIKQVRLLDFGCYYTQPKYEEMYQKYKQLETTSRQCLKEFLALNPQTKMRADQFATLCSAFPRTATGTISINAFARAVLVLDDYFDKGFAVKDCALYEQPSSTETSLGTELTYQSSQTICFYTPKPNITGCVDKFKTDTEREASNWNAGLFTGLIILVIAIILIQYVHYRLATGD